MTLSKKHNEAEFRRMKMADSAHQVSYLFWILFAPSQVLPIEYCQAQLEYLQRYSRELEARGQVILRAS